jgi:hypothetical protein
MTGLLVVGEVSSTARPFARHALRLLDDGFEVGAVTPDKSAAAFGGVSQFTTDWGHLVDDLMPKFGHLNPAVRTDGITVLDGDTAPAVEWLLKSVPDAPAVWTARGVHVYLDGETRCRTALEVAPGITIDVKSGSSAYVVAAGAVHPSGKLYRADPDRPHNCRENRPDVPGWLRGLIVGAPRPTAGTETEVSDVAAYVRAAITSEVDQLARAEVGTRNDAANRAAFCCGQLAAYVDENAVVRRLLDAVQTTGLPAREAGQALRSGWNAGKRQPRKLVVAQRKLTPVLEWPPAGLPLLPTERDPEGPLPKEVDRCQVYRLTYATATGGAFWVQKSCWSWRCERCGARRADQVIRAVCEHETAGAYFDRWSTQPPHEYPAGLPSENLQWETGRVFGPWVTVVSARHDDKVERRAALKTVSDRASGVGGEWLAVILTKQIVIFSTHDLSRPARSGTRGRPAGPPHDGRWLASSEAYRYLSDAVRSEDVVKLSHSQGWMLDLERPQTHDGRRWLGCDPAPVVAGAWRTAEKVVEAVVPPDQRADKLIPYATGGHFRMDGVGQYLQDSGADMVELALGVERSIADLDEDVKRDCVMFGLGLATPPECERGSHRSREIV